MKSRRLGLWRECFAEAVGTFLLIFFGTGAGLVGVCTDALPGLLPVALVWGVTIALAILPRARSAARTSTLP